MRGITPIISIVILIGIAVTLIVGLYFWVETVTSPQPTAPKPDIIGVNPITTIMFRGAKGTLVLVQNLGQSNITTKCLQTEDGQITQNGHEGYWCVFLNSSDEPATVTIPPGQQKGCVLMDLEHGQYETVSSKKYTGSMLIFGKVTGLAKLRLVNSPVIVYMEKSGEDICS